MLDISVISIRQPWAWLIVNGFKDIENRSWPTTYRGEIFIHAAKTYTVRTHDEMASMLEDDFGIQLPEFNQLETGGVVGGADIIDCVRSHSSEWKIPGDYGFVLDNPYSVDFIPLRGQLGIFKSMELLKHF